MLSTEDTNIIRKDCPCLQEVYFQMERNYAYCGDVGERRYCGMGQKWVEAGPQQDKANVDFLVRRLEEIECG